MMMMTGLEFFHDRKNHRTRKAANTFLDQLSSHYFLEVLCSRHEYSSSLSTPRAACLLQKLLVRSMGGEKLPISTVVAEK